MTAVDTSTSKKKGLMYTVYFEPIVCSGSLVSAVCSDQLRWINDVAQDPTVCLSASTTVVRPTISGYVEPTTYRQARGFPDCAEWMECTGVEFAALVKKGVLRMARLPPGVRTLATIFAYKLKRTPDGPIDKYKCRLVAKGFIHMVGVDRHETFAPGFQIVSHRCLLTLSLRLNLEVTHVDVKPAFLNSTRTYTIWIKLPEGFTDENAADAQLVRPYTDIPRLVFYPGGLHFWV